MHRLIEYWQFLTDRLRGFGDAVPPLLLRAVLGWEFWEAGMQKLNGSNWFAGIQGNFPFPMNMLSADLNWLLATWAELLCALALWFGLGTRIAAFVLLCVTFVATLAVHWPAQWGSLAELFQGYAITNKGAGNFKLPLLFAVMLLPLLFSGAGRISLDHLLAKFVARLDLDARCHDATAWAIGLALIGIPFLFLIPGFGIALLVLALLLVAGERVLRS